MGGYLAKVIDEWIMGESINCNGWEGNLYVIKRGDKHGR